MSNRRNAGLGHQVLGKTLEIGGNIKDIGTLVKEAVAERFAELGEGAMSYGRQSRDQMLKLRDDTAAYVEKRPFKSLMIAAGAGILLSLLLRRRR